jgi:hypothetical protein
MDRDSKQVIPLSAAPSIKGSVFAAVVEDVAKLLETGDLSKAGRPRISVPPPGANGTTKVT